MKNKKNPYDYKPECINCGNRISSKEEFCPKCEYPNEDYKKKEEFNFQGSQKIVYE